MHTTALVLFSGGQDSTTCLAHALTRYERVETLAFDYGQRHKVELDARLNVLAAIKARFPAWSPKLGEDHLLDAGILGQISETSLTRDTAIEMESSGLPNTFVPGRNLLFLTLAAALAYRRGLQVIVTGVCETDFSGYPDCRDDTMKAMQVALSLGMDRKLLIETPLMWIDKAQTWQLAHDGKTTQLKLPARVSVYGVLNDALIFSPAWRGGLGAPSTTTVDALARPIAAASLGSRTVTAWPSVRVAVPTTRT